MAWERAIEHEAKKMHENGYRSGHVNEWAGIHARYSQWVKQIKEQEHGPCTDDFPPENK